MAGPSLVLHSFSLGFDVAVCSGTSSFGCDQHFVWFGMMTPICFSWLGDGDHVQMVTTSANGSAACSGSRLTTWERITIAEIKKAMIICTKV